MHIMEKPKLIVLAIGLLLSGCLFQFSDSNPYTGLSCQDKIEKMVRELQAFEAVGQPWAKVSASDTLPADTSAGARIPSDTAVAGGAADANPDSRYVQGGNGYTVLWIPPAGFSDSNPIIPSLHPDTTLTTTRDTTPLKPMPRSITALQIISTGPYRAHIRILDYKLDLVREMDQEFGYQGEMDNVSRDVPKGLVSYLVWDNLTSAGRRAQDGVYLWKVRMTTESNAVVDRIAKTGLIGDECRPGL